MPKVFARCTTSAPMLPVPITPSVLPRSSRPEEYFFFSHFPALVLCEASLTWRARASKSARVCSATETLFPPAAFDGADHHQHVEVVEVAEMRDAEDPSFRRVLAAHQLDPVLLEEVLDQLFRVDSVGREHGGHRRARAFRIERKPQRLHAGAGGAGHAVVAREDVLQALLAEH